MCARPCCPWTPFPTGKNSGSPKVYNANLVPHPPMGSRERVGRVHHSRVAQPMLHPNPIMTYEDPGTRAFLLLTQVHRASPKKRRYFLSAPKRQPPIVTQIPISDNYHNLKIPRRMHVCHLNCHSVKNNVQSQKIILLTHIWI